MALTQTTNLMNKVFRSLRNESAFGGCCCCLITRPPPLVILSTGKRVRRELSLPPAVTVYRVYFAAECRLRAERHVLSNPRDNSLTTHRFYGSRYAFSAKKMASLRNTPSERGKKKWQPICRSHHAYFVNFIKSFPTPTGCRTFWVLTAALHSQSQCHQKLVRHSSRLPTSHHAPKQPATKCSASGGRRLPLPQPLLAPKSCNWNTL